MALAVSATANAVTITTTGTWGTPTGGQNINNNDPGGFPGGVFVNWGTGFATGTTSGQSGYVFQGDTFNAGTIVDGSIVEVGTFTHRNKTINAGSSITGVDLALNFIINSPPAQNLTYPFIHFETPNNATPCDAGGSIPCPDLVTIGNPSPNELVFDLGGGLKLTALLGFSNNGGNSLVNSFLTNEDANNSAKLYAKFTTELVPLPAAGWFLLTGLAGLFGLRRVGGAAAA